MGSGPPRSRLKGILNRREFTPDKAFRDSGPGFPGTIVDFGFSKPGVPKEGRQRAGHFLAGLFAHSFPSSFSPPSQMRIFL